MKTADSGTLGKAMLLTVLILAAAAALADEAAGPDDLEIGTISHWFQPAPFTHGDHADMIDCAACHHMGGADDPGLCSDCHMPTFDPDEPLLPSLKRAYHLNCVGCHQDMGGPTECTDCHERKALPEGPALGGYPE